MGDLAVIIDASAGAGAAVKDEGGSAHACRLLIERFGLFPNGPGPD